MGDEVISNLARDGDCATETADCKKDGMRVRRLAGRRASKRRVRAKSTESPKLGMRVRKAGVQDA